MISTPWLPRTAPIKVIRLRTNRIQCSRSMSRRSLPAGPCASEQPSIEEQRLGDKQHQGKPQPYCHHRVHPQICHRQKAVPQIEPDDHVKAGEPGQHRRDARLPAKTPLNGLEEDDPLSWGMGITRCRQQYRRHEDHTADPQDDGEDVEGAGERYIIHRAGSRRLRLSAQPRFQLRRRRALIRASDPLP